MTKLKPLSIGVIRELMLALHSYDENKSFRSILTSFLNDKESLAHHIRDLKHDSELSQDDDYFKEFNESLKLQAKELELRLDLL